MMTSKTFASASASGTDWRDTSKKVLEALNAIRTEGDGFTIGFLYITDNLAADAGNILTLFRSVLGIDHWAGSVGTVICETGCAYSDEPAISVMIGRISMDDFRVFPPVDIDAGPVAAALAPWLDVNEPQLSIVHGDPSSEPEPSHILSALEKVTGSFLVGGLSSSRWEQIQFADKIVSGGVSGVVFGRNVGAFTALSQGCEPIGAVHTVTHCDGNIIRELDGRRAFDVFSGEMKAFMKEYAEHHGIDLEGKESVSRDTPHFEGDVHAAFPVIGSDLRKDYLVRNIIGIDPDNGAMMVAHTVGHGDQVSFVRSDQQTMRVDLTKTLLDLRARVIEDTGQFSPKGGVFISNMARAGSLFSAGKDVQIELVKDIIGDVPLTGFYANGEISNHRLYGYASVLILFI